MLDIKKKLVILKKIDKPLIYEQFTYRPLVLINTAAGEMFERMIKIRMENFLDEKRNISYLYSQDFEKRIQS